MEVMLLLDFDLYLCLYFDLVLLLSSLGTVHVMHRFNRHGQHSKHMTVQVPQMMIRKNHNNQEGSPLVFHAMKEWCSITWKSLEFPIWASVPPPPSTTSRTTFVMMMAPNTKNPNIATTVTGSPVTRGMNPRRQISIITNLWRSMVSVSGHWGSGDKWLRGWAGAGCKGKERERGLRSG